MLFANPTNLYYLVGDDPEAMSGLDSNPSSEDGLLQRRELTADDESCIFDATTDRSPETDQLVVAYLTLCSNHFILRAHFLQLSHATRLLHYLSYDYAASPLHPAGLTSRPQAMIRHTRFSIPRRTTTTATSVVALRSLRRSLSPTTPRTGSQVPETPSISRRQQPAVTHLVLSTCSWSSSSQVDRV